MAMTHDEFETAMADPAATFPTPEEIVRTQGLSQDQKIELLRRWEFQAAEEAVAL